MTVADITFDTQSQSHQREYNIHVRCMLSHAHVLQNTSAAYF